MTMIAPPFTLESAIQKVRLAEDGWNSRDPERVAGAYTVDSVWRNRSEFFSGREAIIEFLLTDPMAGVRGHPKGAEHVAWHAECRRDVGLA